MMKTTTLLISLSLVLCTSAVFSQQATRQEQLDNRIDNQGYWRKAAEKGLTRPNPHVSVPAAKYTGSQIMAISTVTENSPDVVLITGSTSQSENSIFINPNNVDNPLNSNNSTSTPGGGITLYGANKLYSFDAGQTWSGGTSGAGGSNSGDPAALIGRNGRYYIGFINNQSGQSVAYSDDQGTTWTTSVVANAPSGWGNILDKNHMWIDNSPSSPYDGNLYNAWTAFGGNNNNNIEVSRSTNHGASWSSTVNVSGSLNPGSHAQGVNIQTGPNGEVYVLFTIYDNWPSDEDAMGLARSFDGGQTYTSARIIDNIRGIRNSGTGKNMRVNSFPVMAVDISNGPRRGYLYAVWSNIGYPGVNTGNDIDVYMIRSTDQGLTWTAPVRVNQDAAGLGKQHYFPWITCDPVTGTLSVVFYDDRNVGSASCEVYCANSYDGGDTWEDFKVSDVSFTPSPIPGLASGYFGDYIGIAARNGQVYPVWTDNRTGTALTYTSPYQTSTMTAPTNLVAQLNEETGAVNLSWQHTTSATFSYYKIYRNFQLLGTSVWPVYSDQLPNYGTFRYYVTAYYSVEGESGPAIADVQWGNAQAALNPEAIEEFVFPEGTASAVMDFANVGQLPLNFTAKVQLPPAGERDNRAYCSGTGGCGEFIRQVKFGDVNNYSECNGYEDFTDLSATVAIGETLTVTVHNSTNIYPNDVCAIWVDWNQNENFLDDGSITVTGSPGPGPYTANITVPQGAKDGQTRMRIRIKRDSPISPCGLTANGEVEDYSLNVIGWLQASPMSGTIPAGGSLPVTFTMNAAGLELGSYEAHYVITSNDPDNGTIVVPVTMNVTNISLSVTADKDSLCFGGSTTLHALATGGSGNYTYAWTSEPEGFTSTDPDPLVAPEVTTKYMVELTDGSLILHDEITIAVINLPVVDLGPDVAVCEGGQAILEAGAGYASYFWSTGQTGSSITVTEPGSYWVEVANAFGCSARDTVAFSLHPLPVVDLGEDMSFCEGSTVMLSAGSGFSSYAWSTGATSYYINVEQPGEYWVAVTDANGCGADDAVVLTMDPLPLAPVIASGPASVDNFLSPSSDFSCTAGAHATTHEWKLEPAGAGAISASGTNAQVTWMAGFTGTAQVSARGTNDCGESAWSSAHEVAVYSSQDIAERGAISAIRLYPNPSDGNFTLQFRSATEQEFIIRLTTAGGVRILESREQATAGEYQKTFNLSALPAGSYNLHMLDHSGRLFSTQQVLVQ